MSMRFKLDPTYHGWTSLQRRCPQWFTSVEIERIFGPPNIDACEPEKGYGPEWGFSDENDNPVRLYPRWGAFRIGAQNQEIAERFEIWLCAQGIGEYRKP